MQMHFGSMCFKSTTVGTKVLDIFLFTWLTRHFLQFLHSSNFLPTSIGLLRGKEIMCHKISNVFSADGIFEFKTGIVRILNPDTVFTFFTCSVSYFKNTRTSASILYQQFHQYFKNVASSPLTCNNINVHILWEIKYSTRGFRYIGRQIYFEASHFESVDILPEMLFEHVEEATYFINRI